MNKCSLINDHMFLFNKECSAFFLIFLEFLGLAHISSKTVMYQSAVYKVVEIL